MKIKSKIIKTLLIVIILQIQGCNNEKNEERNNNTTAVKNDTLVEYSLKNIPKNLDKYKNEALILGTFHFNRSTDGSDVVAQKHIDVTTQNSQADIELLVDKIVIEFKPTKIVVEWMPKFQKDFDSLFVEYKNGNWKLGKNEAFQIGFRVADRLGLSGVICIDNKPPQPETVTSVDDWEAYALDLGQKDLWKEYDDVNNVFNNYLDNLQDTLGLLDYLKVLNSHEVAARTKQFFFKGLVNLGHGDKYVGADLTGHWYRRNTRIFVNARNALENPNERLLIIYGNGHKWILEEMLKGSGEFEVRDVNTILK